MPIRPLDEWAAGRHLSLPLSALKGAVIGVDASHYISQHLTQPTTREPLLVALGGFPFSLRTTIENEIQTFRNLGIALVFVFNGLDFGRRDQRPRVQTEYVRAFEQAWDFYDQQQADQVVDAFSNAGTPPPETLYRFLQRILFQNGVDFIVAPYSAAAQLSYLVKGSKGSNPLLDAVFGPSEILLFGVDKLITRIDLKPATFFWITRQTLQEELGRLSNDQFVDFCLLLGSSFLRPFPLFENPSIPGKPLNIRDSLTMFNVAGRNALALCAQFEDDRRVQDLQYTDRYKRAFLAVKHHVFMDVEGRVEPMDAENIPSDVHELISQRLPDELYFYLSKGILSAKIPNYLTSGEVLVSLPLGAEDTTIYRRTVSDVLNPIRAQSIGLLSNSMHRFYQNKVINVRTWYDERSDKLINLRFLPSVKDAVQSWKLSSQALPESVRNLQSRRGSFRFAVQSLKCPDFVPKSFSEKDAPVLSSQDDILQNVFWRFLQLRGYIDDKHQLTPWGAALEQALAATDPAENLEEATFLGVELLRLGLLNSTEWFSNVSGGPVRGSDDDKTYNQLVSRVACIAKLRHKNTGYSGPLSRQLLCYRSVVSEVRTAMRDQIEIVLTGMLLSGNVDRARRDWTELSVKLPFIDDNDCGLGIAVRTYLDDLPLQNNPTSPEARAEVKAKGKEWFQHSDSFTASLDTAFRLWDAVYKASQSVKGFRNAKLWDDANGWLAQRR